MKVLLNILFILSILPSWSQDTLRVPKSEVLAKVLEENHTIKISRQEVLSSQAEHNQTNAIFLPKITLSHTGFITTNPLMAFGSKLNQERISNNDFNPDLLNDPDRTQNVATKLEVQQPLINFDGIWMRKAARSKLEATLFQQQRTIEYLEYEVDRSYAALQLAEKQVEVMKTNLKAAESNLAMARMRYDQGYLQIADVLIFEVRKNEVANQLFRAKSGLQMASDYISFLMNNTDGQIILASESLNPENYGNETRPQLSLTRSDILAMQEATNAYAHVNKADILSFLPNINAFGSYELYDRNLFQADANGYLVGIGLNWTLLDGSKRIGKAQKSKAEFEKAQTELEQYKYKSTIELNDAWRRLQDARNNLELSEQAKTQAEEALKIRTNRFREGLERPSDLLMAEAMASNKELAYFQAIYEYNTLISFFNYLNQNQ